MEYFSTKIHSLFSLFLKLSLFFIEFYDLVRDVCIFGLNTK